MSQVQWDVLEEEQSLPLAETTPPDRRNTRGWLALLGALLLVVALLVTGLTWWQARVQRERLRADIEAVAREEARLVTVSPLERVAVAEQLLIPEPSEVWRQLYFRMPYQPTDDLVALPEVRDVQLQPGGRLTLVEVVWPALPGALGEVAEWRAYRLVEGSWRRAPYPLGDESSEDVPLDGLVLRATPTDRALLEERGLLTATLALRDHLHESWPASLLRQGTLYLAVDPREFESSVQMNFGANATTILVNSPRFEPRNPTSRLSAGAQYRLALGYVLMMKLVVTPPFEGALDSVDARARVARSQDVLWALRTAEARHWALDDGERAALRDATRATLGDSWPLDTGTPEGTLFGLDDSNRDRAALDLLMDFLVEREGRAVLARLAHATVDQEPTAFSLDQAVQDATGTSLQALDEELRAFARTAGR